MSLIKTSDDLTNLRIAANTAARALQRKNNIK
jgi:hypothetical protein